MVINSVNKRYVPKLRFKGFEGEYKEIKISDVSKFYKGDGYYKNIAYYYDGSSRANHKITVDKDRTFRVVNFNTEIACLLCELSQKGFIEICEEEKKSKIDKAIDFVQKSINSSENLNCKELLEILKGEK